MQTIGTGPVDGELEDRLVAAAGRDPAQEDANEGPENTKTDTLNDATDGYAARAAATNARG